jgi:hypothetical protein
VPTLDDDTVLQPPRFELKARDRDPGRSLAICTLLGAEPGREAHQRDTYFQGDRGRLRLREEEDGGGAYLFADERIVLAGAQPRRWKFDIARPDIVLQAFAGSLGVETAVVSSAGSSFGKKWESISTMSRGSGALSSFNRLRPTRRNSDVTGPRYPLCERPLRSRMAT